MARAATARRGWICGEGEARMGGGRYDGEGEGEDLSNPPYLSNFISLETPSRICRIRYGRSRDVSVRKM